MIKANGGIENFVSDLEVKEDAKLVIGKEDQKLVIAKEDQK